MKHNWWTLMREARWLILPVIGYYTGDWLQGMEDERMTKFRDKSALYGRELAPGEKPSWP